MPEEQVVLVDEQNVPIGTTPKSTVHSDRTPLHRGFSLFLFRSTGELLLQQRAATKKTWPFVWSNSCCGHPAMDEGPVDAARRRISDELGIRQAQIDVVLPDYRYRAERDGVVENEFCPVLVGASDEPLILNPDEVATVRWCTWKSFIEQIRNGSGGYSPWCVEEALLLDNNPLFRVTVKRLGIDVALL